MASSGGSYRTPLSDRQSLGLFCLGVGVVLFALILMRGEQAARDGDLQSRRDTYWVLVSPLVFSAFGVSLLRFPQGGPFPIGGRRAPQPVMQRPQVRRALQRSERSTHQAEVSLARLDHDASQKLSRVREQADAALASVALLEGERDRAKAEAEARIRDLEQELVQVQEARDALEADLRRLTASRITAAGEALAAVEAVGGQADALTASLNERISSSLRQLDDLILRHEQQLQQLRQDASQAQTSLSQLRSDHETRLAALRAEAAAAISSAQQAQLGSRATATEVSEQMAAMDGRIQEAQETCTRAEATLTGAIASTARVHSEARASAVTAQRVAEDLGLRLNARMDAAYEKLAAAVQANQDAQAVLENQLDAAILEQRDGAPQPPEAQDPDAQGADPTVAEALAGARDPFRDPALRCYGEACAELGLAPGRPWKEVWAAWHRNVDAWNPTRGGDAGLWPRRLAAYRLLEAWYEFDGAT